MIKARGIEKKYGHNTILKGVDLDINQGEIISIVGPSGAGKTTLLQILGTLEKMDHGEIYFEDLLLSKLKESQLAKFRNNSLGFVFQFHNLLPEFNALENVILPGLIAKKSKSALELKAKNILETLKMSHRLENKPGELSGGEQQRIAVARALINDPKLILADEPSGNLDSENANDLHQLFFQLRKDFNQTFVVVTHNQQFAAMADRTLTMRDGLFA